VKTVNLILRWIVGGMFVFAAVVKIWNVNINPAHEGANVTVTIRASAVPDLKTFADQVANYRVPPREVTNLVAMTLPWIELVAGLLLIGGIWKRASAVVISVLVVVFLIAIGQAVARGLNISCGCFGTVEGRKVGVVALAQDLVLLGITAWLAWRLED
jgi:uncharacterized membrane protein YphA (DoxX/SURF4 family)